MGRNGGNHRGRSAQGLIYEQGACFLDGANLFCALNDLGAKVHWRSLFKIIRERVRCRELESFFFLDEVENPTSGRLSFIRGLEAVGVNVIEVEKPEKLRRKGGRKVIRKPSSQVDQRLGAEMIANFFILKPRPKVVVLVAGDVDYLSALEMMSRQNVRIFIVSEARRLSARLREDGRFGIILLDHLVQQVDCRYGRGRGGRGYVRRKPSHEKLNWGR